jgi:hypothetical protein
MSEFPFFLLLVVHCPEASGLLDELEFVEQATLLKLLFGDRVGGCRGNRGNDASCRYRLLFGSCSRSRRGLSGSLSGFACLPSAGSLRFLPTVFFLPLVMALFALRQLLPHFLKQRSQCRRKGASKLLFRKQAIEGHVLLVRDAILHTQQDLAWLTHLRLWA